MKLGQFGKRMLSLAALAAMTAGILGFDAAERIFAQITPTPPQPNVPIPSPVARPSPAALLLPHVPTNAALQAVCTNEANCPAGDLVARWGVIRDGVSARGDAPNLTFTPSSSPCSLGGGVGDVGTQSQSADGGCWLALPTSYFDFRQFGPDKTGVQDTTGIYNNFIAAVEGVLGTGYVPNGVYRFLSHPNCITSPIRLLGAGIGNAQINRDYNGSGEQGLVCINSGASGTVIDGFTIESTSGRTGGAMVSIIAQTNANIGLVSLSNLDLTSAGASNTQDYNLVADGCAAAGPGPVGIRTLSLKNVHVFGAAQAPAYLACVEGVHWSGGGEYQAPGAPAQAGIVVTGNSTVPSAYVDIDVTDILDGVSLDWVNYVQIKTTNLGGNAGANSVSNTANVTYAIVDSSYMAFGCQKFWDANSGCKIGTTTLPIAVTDVSLTMGLTCASGSLGAYSTRSANWQHIGSLVFYNGEFKAAAGTCTAINGFTIPVINVLLYRQNCKIIDQTAGTILDGWVSGGAGNVRAAPAAVTDDIIFSCMYY